jgi:hypothetical protein
MINKMACCLCTTSTAHLDRRPTLISELVEDHTCSQTQSGPSSDREKDIKKEKACHRPFLLNLLN